MKQVLSARGAAPVSSSVSASVEAVIAEYGAWRVLLQALQSALFAPRPALADIKALDDRLRRDIGLPPLSQSPPDWHLLR
jgi:hypothetical protein